MIVKKMNSKQIVKNIENNIKGKICSKSYIHLLLDLKESMKEFCKTYLEIGTLHGGSISLLCHSKYKTYFIGIDDFNFYKRIFNGKTEVKKQNAINNIKKFNKKKYKIDLIEGNSHDRKVFGKIKQLCDNNIQLLLIDGDHTKKGIKKDFEMYSPLVEKNGYIFFDDYSHKAWPGIEKGIDELNFNTWNFIDKGKYYYIIQRK